ncbi:MAG: Thiol peroxidase, Tpx-type [Acidimicrobiia bacterium]|nr:Thiol peroxidase, Tpx-type [Acidimicrobiia bacterium]
MSEVTLRGNTFHTSGELPAVGAKAPAFTVTKTDLSALTLADLAGKKVVLNIFPSLDTGVCATSVRTFNSRAAEAGDAVVLNVSADLPFAQARFCGAEGITNVEVGSIFRNPDFGDSFGVRLTDGPMAGLLARSVVVLDESGTVLYSQLVPEISSEPDYDSALAAVK